MKIKNKLKDFMEEHPALVSSLAVSLYLGVLTWTLFVGATTGVSIANNALKDVAIKESGITVADFLTKYGPLKTNK